MTTATSSYRARKFLVPEIIQTSSMDCGPAALSALLNGLGVRASYGRLREACQTEVDGTSIDTLEDVAAQLGLVAEQVLIPADHLFLDVAQSLPAIVVVRHPSGVPHFVVLWRTHGDIVQIMDPATGRKWQRQAQFLQELFVHSQVVPAGMLRGWLKGAGFQKPLVMRMEQLGLKRQTIDRLLAAAKAEKSWKLWAQLDAAVRMAAALVDASAVGRGAESDRLVEQLALRTDAAEIPESFWAVRPFRSEPPAPTDAKQAILRGAVLVSIRGQKEEAPKQTEQRMAGLPMDLRAALVEPPVRPMRMLIGYLPKGQLALTALSALAAFATAFLMLEMDALFRGMLHLAWYIRTAEQRLAAPILASLFLVGLFALTLLNQWNVTRIGRYLEIRLRAALSSKLPTLNDHYFHSRPISDMTERAHSLARVRQLPQLFVDGLRALAMTTLTALALIWLVPGQGPVVLALLMTTLAMPLLLQPLFLGLDMRVRTMTGTLIRSYLDALIGISPTRTHGAERTLARDQEETLSNWVRVRLSWLRVQVGAQGVQALVGYVFISWLVVRYLAGGGDAAGLLLLFYWAMALPGNAGELAATLQQYPDLRNVLLRLIEPLGAPSESPEDLASVTTTHGGGSVSITLRGVSVVLAGRPILQDISIDIPAGTHVAIVGISGAGKSTLIGLLLGFHRAAAGEVLIDHQPVSDEDLVHLRRSVAWVDPDIRLWNRSLFDNLHYCEAGDRGNALSEAIAGADLARVMGRLPEGLATQLGEGGRLVSGGEGQRVRLARTMMQQAPRLVLLDEPFRGLDRTQRQELLDRARKYWEKTTLLYVSHDIATTLSFPHVLIIEDGHLVESGDPVALSGRPDSRYTALLRAEKTVRHDLWASKDWQRVAMVDGQLVSGKERDAAEEER